MDLNGDAAYSPAIVTGVISGAPRPRLASWWWMPGSPASWDRLGT